MRTDMCAGMCRDMYVGMAVGIVFDESVPTATRHVSDQRLYSCPYAFLIHMCRRVCLLCPAAEHAVDDGQ